MVGGDTDLVDTAGEADLLDLVGDGEADPSNLAGVLVSPRAPDEVIIPPRYKVSVFLPATQCVSKCWYKCSITLALR